MTILDDKKNIELTKIQVAENQVNTAIFLMFEEIDIVSSHALMAGSYEILRAAAKSNGIKFETFWDRDTAVNEETGVSREQWVKVLSAPQNFFKHGSRDLNKKLVFNPAFTHMMLYDSVLLFQKISGRETPEMLSYRLWFGAHYLLTLMEPNTPIKKLLFDLKKKYNPENLKDYAIVLKRLKQSNYPQANL